MDIVTLIIQLVSGLVGGTAAGAALKDKSLGMIGNAVTGLLGGGLGGIVMQMLDTANAAGVQNMDIQSIITAILGGEITIDTLHGKLNVRKVLYCAQLLLKKLW